MDAVASYHHFTAIRYFGASGGQRKKFARAPLSVHVDSNHLLTVLRWFWMICLQQASSIRKDLAQVVFDLVDRLHVNSVKTQYQRQT